MYSALEGHSNLGIPKNVAAEYLAKDMAPVLAPNAAIPAGVRRLARDAVEGIDMSEEDWRGLIDGLVKFFSEEKREPEHAHDEEPKTLYIKKPVLNADALRDWAKAQGFKTTLPADDMHVTLAFSKTPVEWAKVLDKGGDHLTQDGGSEGRSIEPLGDKGAIVLRFESPALTERWQQILDAGASWDHDGFRPHVTITYDAGDLDLSKVTPYDGLIELGGEVRAEVDGDWADKVKNNLQAVDAKLAMDRSFTPRADSRFLIAQDRDTVREKTRDGRLVVKKTNISKANVCPYRGEEIPGWEELGLDPQRVYNLLRDPEELAKAAPSLNGVQLLKIHKPVSADDHKPYDTVGSLGTDAEFDGEYLTNSIFVNARESIDGIESGKQRELSAGYHYKPDMTPGNFRGTAYDGVMREIVFNHVALVSDGRAGPDVIVADEALKESKMVKATRFGAMVLALTGSQVAPLLAQDQKITLTKDLFAPLTSKNFKDSKPKLLAGVRLAMDGKLKKGIALDASMEKIGKAFDDFSSNMGSMDEPAPEDKMSDEPAIEAVKAPVETGSTYDAEPLKGFLRDCGMDEEKIAKCMDMMPKAMAGDEDDEEAKKKKAEEEKAAQDKAAKDAEMDKDKITKPAMDAALKAQADHFQKELTKVRDTERGVRVAIAEVHPWTGDLPASMAFDSATDVYRHALVMKNVDGAKTLHADALLPILKTLPKNGVQPRNDSGDHHLAMDSSAVSEAIKMAPGLENISTVL
jgi:hypothetical protein